MLLSFRRPVGLLGGLLVAALLSACGHDTTAITPNVPTGLTATAYSPTEIRLTWAPTAGAASYAIQRSVGGSPFIQIAISDTAGFRDVTVQPATQYSYRVAGVAGTVFSAFSAPADATSLVVGPKVVKLSGDITTSRSLSADTTYILSGLVKVRSGATLTIPAGTTIVGDTTVAGSSLWILPGAQIYAQGTAAKPVVFTSQRAPGHRAPGDWGGIVIIGRGRVNRLASGAAASTVVTRGPTPGEPYGGSIPSDTSGSLRYVRIEFAGYSTGPEQDIGALSSYGVGSGTRYEHVETMASKGDGFQFFGGAPDMRFLVSYEAGDDAFDWSEGFSGRGQFIIGFQSTQLTPAPGSGPLATDPHGLEGDGCELGTPGCASYAATPYSMPVWANFTLVGAGPNGSLQAATENQGVTLRRGTGGTFINGVVARWKGTGWNVRDQATDALRALDSLSATAVYLAENGGGPFDPANACTSSGSGGSCGTQANFPGITALGNTAASLFVSIPASGSTPSIGDFDWTPPSGTPLANGGTTTVSARVQARLSGFFGNPLPLTSYAGAAPPGGPQWWVGWTSYARN